MAAALACRASHNVTTPGRPHTPTQERRREGAEVHRCDADKHDVEQGMDSLLLK